MCGDRYMGYGEVRNRCMRCVEVGVCVVWRQVCGGEGQVYEVC